MFVLDCVFTMKLKKLTRRKKRCKKKKKHAQRGRGYMDLLTKGVEKFGPKLMDAGLDAVIKSEKAYKRRRR